MWRVSSCVNGLPLARPGLGPCPLHVLSGYLVLRKPALGVYIDLLLPLWVLLEKSQLGKHVTLACIVRV